MVRNRRRLSRHKPAAVVGGFPRRAGGFVQKVRAGGCHRLSPSIVWRVVPGDDEAGRTVFLEFVAEDADVAAKQAGGPGPIATGMSEGGKDMLPFQFFEGDDAKRHGEAGFNRWRQFMPVDPGMPGQRLCGHPVVEERLVPEPVTGRPGPLGLGRGSQRAALTVRQRPPQPAAWAP